MLNKPYYRQCVTKHKLGIPGTVWHNPLHFVAFGCGIGVIPIAPGTFATLLAIPVYLMLRKLGPEYYLLLLYILTLAAMWLSDVVAHAIQVHDHPGMCIDEVIGYLVTMIYAPPGNFWLIMGFVLFRIFDIFKPQPIRFIDTHVGGGFGIVLDDVVAGFCSALIMQIMAIANAALQLI